MNTITNLENYSSEQLKNLLRDALSAKPLDVEYIKALNAELATRPDQKESEEAWQKFASRSKSK